VLRPLQPLPLAERESVTVTIGIGADQPRHSHPNVEFIERARTGIGGLDSDARSSWADYIMAEREDRL